MTNFYTIELYERHTDKFDTHIKTLCIVQGYTAAKQITAELMNKRPFDTIYYMAECVNIFESAEEALDYID